MILLPVGMRSALDKPGFVVASQALGFLTRLEHVDLRRVARPPTGTRQWPPLARTMLGVLASEPILEEAMGALGWNLHGNIFGSPS